MGSRARGKKNQYENERDLHRESRNRRSGRNQCRAWQTIFGSIERELETPDFLGTHHHGLWAIIPQSFPWDVSVPVLSRWFRMPGLREPRDAEHRLSEFHGHSPGSSCGIGGDQS